MEIISYFFFRLYNAKLTRIRGGKDEAKFKRNNFSYKRNFK